MAEQILMPRLSDTMTEGVIAAWHKNIGDSVKKGDLLAEIETDKATMELESYKDGVLLHRGAEEGGKLQVNDLLAIVGDKGEDISGLLGGNGKADAGSKSQDASSKKQEPNNKKQEPNNQQPETGNQQPETGNQKSETGNVDISKMEEVVLMPRLSDTMTEGVIASWQKNVGDDVKKGDILAEIETDKATMELESYKDGKLLYQGAKQGEKIVVNDLLAIIGKEGFDVNKVVAAAKGGSGQQQERVVKDNADQQKAEGDVSKTASSGVPQQKVEDTAHEPEQQVVNEGRIFASPLAKKLAEEKGIDLKYVKGTGDNGRITKSDIDNYQPVRSEKAEVKQGAPSTQPAQKQQPIVATPTYTKEDFEEVPVSQMRKTIARRLAESKFSAPHFYLTMSIDMDACVAARAKLNEISPVKISFNDIVLKAVAVALKQHPKVNSSWLGEKIRINHHINIGVAVAVDEGLLVPVVRFADTKSLSQIAGEVKILADKAKNKKLQPAEWEGSTFTISNLGMFGIDEFTAIINPPDACILAIGGIAQIPVVKNNAVVPGNVMKVTLSCDHRVVDGATGSAFLQTLKSLLEEPLRMMI